VDFQKLEHAEGEFGLEIEFDAEEKGRLQEQTHKYKFEHQMIIRLLN